MGSDNTATNTGQTPAQSSTTPPSMASSMEPTPTKKPLKFGDMEGMTADDYEKLQEPDDGKPLPGESDDDDDSGREDSGDDSDIDDDEEESDSDDDEEDEESDEDESDEEGEESEESASDEETFIEVTVDGKKRKFTKEQAQSIIASNVHTLENRRKWQDTVKAKETEIGNAIAEITAVNQKITPAYEALQKKDITGALLSLAQQAGISTLEARRTLRKQLAPTIIKLAQMTDEQYRQFELEEQNEWLTEENQRLTKKPNSASDQGQDGHAQLLAAQRQHGISDAEMIENRDWYLQSVLQGDESKLTLDGVVEAVMTRRAVDKAVAAVKLRKPSLMKDADFVDAIVKKAKESPDLSVLELGRIVNKRAKKLGQKRATEQVTKEGELQRTISSKVLKNKAGTSNQSSDSAPKMLSFRDMRQKMEEAPDMELP